MEAMATEAMDMGTEDIGVTDTAAEAIEATVLPEEASTAAIPAATDVAEEPSQESQRSFVLNSLRVENETRL